MPWSLNGCGTMYCGQAAAVAWEKPDFSGANPPDQDAVLCVTFLMVPLIPLRPCHVFDQLGGAGREVRLRWSAPLVLRAMLRPWCLLVTGIGALFLTVFAFEVAQSLLHGTGWRPPDWNPLPVVKVILGLLPVALFGLRWFHVRDRHDRDIRIVIGPYAYGSSDPALWQASVLRNADVEKLIGGRDPKVAAEKAFRQGHFSRAMLAARLQIALGDPSGGKLSEQLLQDQRVGEMLSRTRKKPWIRGEQFPAVKAASPSPPADGILFYDGRRYPRELLDQVGGPGFGSFVRENPTVVRAAPTSLFLRAVLLALALFMGDVAITSPLKEGESRGGMLLGGGFFVAILGWALYDGHTRTVTIGERCLKVSNQRVLLDAIKRIVYEKHVGIFPVVSVYGVGSLSQWTRRKGENEELDRILHAVLALRQLAPLDGTGELKARDMSVHL